MNFFEILERRLNFSAAGRGFLNGYRGEWEKERLRFLKQKPILANTGQPEGREVLTLGCVTLAGGGGEGFRRNLSNTNFLACLPTSDLNSYIFS